MSLHVRQQFPRLIGAFFQAVCALAPFLVAFTIRAQAIDPADRLPERHCPKLAEILTHAIQQSPAMLAKSLELSKADADLLVAEAVRYPNLGGSLRYGIEGVATSDSPSSTSQGFFYNLNLGQAVFHWGSIQAGIRIGSLQKKIAERQYAEAYRDLATGIRGQFLFLMLKKRAMLLRRQALALAERNFAAEKEKLKEGQVAPGQLQSTELNLEEERIAMSREVLEFEKAKRTLVRMAGLTDIADADIPDSLPRPAWETGIAETFVQQALRRLDPTSTPSALVYTYLIRQSELKYTQAQARLLPKVDLSLGTSQENQTYLAGDRVQQSATQRQSAGIAANWTLFDGFATRGAKRLALTEKRQAERQLQVFLETLSDQRAQLVQQAELSARSLELAEKRNVIQQGTLPYLEEEVRQGRMSPVQFAQLKSGVSSSDLATLSARVDLYLRWADIVSLMWADPQLKQLPARYLSEDKSPGAGLLHYWPW